MQQESIGVRADVKESDKHLSGNARK